MPTKACLKQNMAEAEVPERLAVSTGRCNTLVKSFSWCFKFNVSLGLSLSRLATAFNLFW
jgi:hypothetical protein